MQPILCKDTIKRNYARPQRGKKRIYFISMTYKRHVSQINLYHPLNQTIKKRIDRINPSDCPFIFTNNRIVRFPITE